MKLTIQARIKADDKWAKSLSMEEIRERIEQALNAGRRFPIEDVGKVKIVRKLT